MGRYYGALHAVVESHGGRIVKLLGDGVMAAFGLPRVAEDDAVRAVRAALAMQQAFRALAREQSAAIGAIGLRVAANTGEVVVDTATDDVVGDPVNVAARLQDVAQDGDVVIGEATRRLVGALVTLAPLGPVALKGRAETVAAYRVVSLERPAGASAAFVGREEELTRLGAVYDAARAAPAARLAVVLGSPGLGKTRLLDEFTRRLDGATVLVAHCEAAGGATFAPIAKALRAVLGAGGGHDLRRAIDAAVPGSDADRSRIAAGIGALLAGTPASPEETFFVVRRLLGFTGLIEWIEGDIAAAERSLRTAYDGLRSHGLAIDAARASSLLGRTLLAQGRAAEAEALSHESEALAGDDLLAAITWRRVRAEALTGRGDHAGAAAFARAAVDIASATDALIHHAEARLALAAALRAAGRADEADAEEKRAIELWDAKGATVLAERARLGRVDQAKRALDDPAAPARPVRRRAAANGATAFAARTEAVIAARDADALPGLFADGQVTVHHPTGIVYDGEAGLASWRSLIPRRGPDPHARAARDARRVTGAVSQLDFGEPNRPRQVRRRALRARRIRRARGGCTRAEPAGRDLRRRPAGRRRRLVVRALRRAPARRSRAHARPG
jgi:tetratricopeptide (TPR) repeat protein